MLTKIRAGRAEKGREHYAREAGKAVVVWAGMVWEGELRARW